VEHRLVTSAALALALMLPLAGCIGDADLRGFVRSEDPVDRRFGQSLDWNFRNGPREIALDSDTYTLLIGADSHIGDTANIAALFRHTRTGGSAALIMAGDITTGRPEDYEKLAQLLRNSGPEHFYAIPGNHDLYFDGWVNFRALFGSSAYTVELRTPVATDLLICLDTGGGTLGGAQLGWLADLLRRTRGDYRHCLVVTHNNFFRNRFTSSTNPLVEELRVLMDLFTRHRVDLVVCGHDHRRHVENFGPTAYYTLDAMSDGLDYASFLEVTLSGEGIAAVFRGFGGL
jgi:3',5'-cyclic AMP phosphodiesterase CpdA